VRRDLRVSGRCVPDAGLAPPPGDRLRGPYYRWLFFAAGPLEAAATNKAFGLEVPAERKGMVGYGSLSEVLAVLEAAVSEREYLVGNRFSPADVCVGSHLGWMTQFGMIDKRAAFERYFTRLSARPGAVRAREIDDALVAQARQPSSG
jgi:glutathione S-transferase